MSLVAGIRVCKRGHVQTAENVDVAADGKRRCRPCGQWRNAQRKHTVWVGPVADDHDVHHICPNKACVRPDHLEAIDHAEHTRRHRRSSHASV